jgi:hypothetical protein
MNIMASLTEKDRILIRILRVEKEYNAHMMLIEFPSRKWNKYALHRLIKQIDATGTSNNRNCVRKRSAYLNANVTEFVEPENWPPNSPDLNPVDYSIWGFIQQLVYHEPLRDVEHLQEVILCCWVEITQALVDSAINQWSSRVHAVIKARGGHNY